MRFTTRLAIGGATFAVAAASAVGAFAAAGTHHHKVPGAHKAGAAEAVHLHLTPSSAQLAACMPRARVDVTVQLTTDKLGFDVFTIRGRHLPPNTTFTTFLIEQAGSPFWCRGVHRRLHVQPLRRRLQPVQADRPGGVLLDAGRWPARAGRSQPGWSLVRRPHWG